MIRISKIILILFVGLQGLFYALNNIVNFEAATSFVQGVLPMAGNEAYPNAFGPATWAIMGCVMALLVWFGLFMVIGGAYFQMWQTPLGAAAQGGAFQYAISSGIVLLFVNAPD